MCSPLSNRITASSFRPWSETSNFCFSTMSVHSAFTRSTMPSLPHTCSSASSSEATSLACLGMLDVREARSEQPSQSEEKTEKDRHERLLPHVSREEFTAPAERTEPLAAAATAALLRCGEPFVVFRSSQRGRLVFTVGTSMLDGYLDDGTLTRAEGSSRTISGKRKLAAPLPPAPTGKYPPSMRAANDALRPRGGHRAAGNVVGKQAAWEATFDERAQQWRLPIIERRYVCSIDEASHLWLQPGNANRQRRRVAQATTYLSSSSRRVAPSGMGGGGATSMGVALSPVHEFIAQRRRIPEVM